MQHFLVIRVIVIADNRYSVIELERERVDGVIDEHNVSQVTLVEDAHVFDVEVGVTGTHAAWTVVAGLEVLSFGIDVVDYRIGVLLLRGSEDNNLEVFISGFKAFYDVWSDVDASQHRLGLFGEMDRNDYVRVIGVCIVNAVDQGLVKIEHNRLLFRRMVEVGQLYDLVSDRTELRHLKPAGLDVIKCLDRLIKVCPLHVVATFFVL
jgi:hypothetical protein